MRVPDSRRWWTDVTPYEWLVLTIASAGWIFDVFEGQIFNLTRGQMLADLLGPGASAAAISRWGEIFLGVFLAGGTIGGILFGWLGDRWGRKPTMALTILFYSIFTCLTAFSTDLWQAGVLRFLVAVGVGGEWAVAAALVAEVFPQRARAQASAIFHASSVFGTWLAALAGLAVGSNWRHAYLVGIVPALLILWVRTSVKEPESWKQARQASSSTGGPRLGSFRELLLGRPWGWRTLLGTLLAGIGLGVFWAVTVAGQDLARNLLVRSGVDPASAAEKAKFAYGIVQATGCGLGLLAFGPLCERIGRRGAFVAFQVAALLVVPATCYLPQNYATLLVMLPVYGFVTIGMQAGFAVAFPELFPHRLRSTGTGFCFNAGRLVAAAILLLSGWIKSRPGIDLRLALVLLNLLFVPGIVIALLLPETKDKPLPA